MADPVDGAALIDWRLAASVARTLAPSGPPLGREQARTVVRQLHEVAAEAGSLVEQATQLGRQ